MKTLRHKNGNGRKGVYSEVYADSSLDKNSLVLGENSDILKSMFIGSKADDCFVFDSFLQNSEIFATVLIKSMVTNSDIDCEYVAASDVYNSRISGESKIKNAILNNVAIKNVTIDGAQLYNFGTPDSPVDLECGYITGGVWHRAPRVIRFGERNVTLTEAEDNQLHVNCRKFPTLEWIKKAAQYARLYNLSKDELSQAIKFAETLLD